MINHIIAVTRGSELNLCLPVGDHNEQVMDLHKNTVALIDLLKQINAAGQSLLIEQAFNAMLNSDDADQYTEALAIMVEKNKGQEQLDFTTKKVDMSKLGMGEQTCQCYFQPHNEHLYTQPSDLHSEDCPLYIPF